MECLVISTDIAFEIWLVKPNSHRVNAKPVFNLGPSGSSHSVPSSPNVEVECIYRKREDNISIVDFLNMDYVYYRGNPHLHERLASVRPPGGISTDPLLHSDQKDASSLLDSNNDSKDHRSAGQTQQVLSS